MIIETIPVGPLQVNCYILGCEESREGIVIDAGGNVKRLFSKIKALNLRIMYLVNTHGHFDHVGGNRAFLETTGGTFLIHKKDAFFLSMAMEEGKNFGVRVENSPEPNAFLVDEMTITFGRQTLRVIHTPGHSPGGCCFYSEVANAVFTGDTIFNGSVGRIDLPGGSMETLIESISERLAVLPEDTKVYPGHGPSTTIAIERYSNPFLRRKR